MYFILVERKSLYGHTVHIFAVLNTEALKL